MILCNVRLFFTCTVKKQGKCKQHPCGTFVMGAVAPPSYLRWDLPPTPQMQLDDELNAPVFIAAFYLYFTGQ